ncbi:MAG: hypothetical protein WC242_05045 [Candidatus Paceibacterota bacterium]|jgi:hypothetical protein
MIKNKKIFWIILVFTILILIVIFFIYRGLNNDNCYNQIKDEQEEGIDCGGVCSVTCESLDKIEILWIKKVQSGNGKDNFLALIHNPNNLYGISSFDYEFIGFNENGEQIVSRKNKDFILPSQTKYLYELNMDRNDGINKIELKISNESWQKFSIYKDPTLSVLSKTVQNINVGRFNLELSGRLVNDSIYNLRSVDIMAVLFDKNDSPVELGSNYLGNIQSREKRDFKILWQSNLKSQEITRMDIYPRINIFEDENFIKDFNYQKVNIKYSNE